MDLQVPLLERYTVDVHRTIAALGGDVFIERIPCHSLHVVIMFSDFVDTFPYQRSVISASSNAHHSSKLTVTCSEDAGAVIGASSNDIFSRGTPCKIIDLHGRATTAKQKSTSQLECNETWCDSPEGCPWLPMLLLVLQLLRSNVTSVACRVGSR